LGLPCLIAAGVLAFVLLSGGDSSVVTANTRPNSKTCTPNEGRTSICPRNKTFDAKHYVGHGDGVYAYCVEFANQADAQAVLRADPDDPNKLDTNRDGIACPQLPAPRDTKPVQAVLKIFRCQPSDERSARCPQPSRRFDPEQMLLSQADEFDCKYFASQADAQAVLRFQPADPNQLDGEDGKKDGIACPMLPGPKDLKPAALAATA
jgi:hypothetical protein